MQTIGLASIHVHPAIILGSYGQVHPGRHAPPAELEKQRPLLPRRPPAELRHTTSAETWS